VLREVCPVFEDGYGPEPSFHWGEMPSPSPLEYGERRAYYDFVFWLPYAGTGVGLSLFGCRIAPWLRRRIAVLGRLGAWGTAVATLGLMAAASLVSDVGGKLGWWQQAIVLIRDFDLFTAIQTLRLFGSISVLTGALEVVDDLEGL
jgi:hypothetical protein